mmetsp:Transcript_47604/g.101885  ORF Transcript_47604/g.101885 Transcript_47604/m.101885 type:complete len:290 (+) Transcript_47604:169-1038(+)
MRSATAKIQVPGAGARLAALLRGTTQELPYSRFGMFSRYRQKLELRVCGFEGGLDYFRGEFLDGARFAFEHLATDVLPRERERCEDTSRAESDTFEVDDIVDAALKRTFREGYKALREDGLDLRWDLEDISNVSLAGHSLVFGARRHPRSPPRDNLVRSAHGLNILVSQPEERPSRSADLTSSASVARGATLRVDTTLVARQTVTIFRINSGEIVAASFDEEAKHCLRLEADFEEQGQWTADELNKMAMYDLFKHRPVFNEEQGWLISDLNDCLDGNCIAKSLPTSLSR